MVFFVLDMKNNTLCIILATRFTLLVERSWKKHVFYSKLACPPATYDVISRNHRHWPSLNFSQNVRSRGINEKFYRLGKKLNPSERGWQPSPPPFNICWNEFKCLPSNLRAGVDVWTQYTLSHLKIYNNLLIIMMMRTTRTRSTSIHPIKFGYDVSVRSPVRTDAGGGERESGVNPLGEDYVIAEVKFYISSTSFVSAVNYMAARTFREKRNESFFPLNFNFFINLDNRERDRATNK